jgi:hypothetical protein
MARPNHPLVEDSFAPLRAEADKLTQAIAAARQAIANAFSGGGGGGRSGKPGSMAAGADGVASAAGGAAGALDNLAKKQEKVVSLSDRLDKAVGKTSAAMSGLQRSVAGVGNIAELLGFERASAQAAQLAGAIAAVRDVMGGLFAASGALASIGAAAVVALAPLAAIQAAVHATTGEAISLGAAISGAVLALNKVGAEGIAGWKLAFNELEQVATAVLTNIGQMFIAMAGRGMQAFSEALSSVSSAINSSGIPGLMGMAKGFDAVSKGAMDAAWALRETYDKMGEASAKGAEETKQANREILQDLQHTREGIETQINKVMDEGKGTLLFRDPVGALKEFGGEIQKAFGFSGGGGGAPSGGGGGASGGGGGGSVGSASSAGHSAGVEYTSGLADALSSAKPEVNQAIVDLLTVDKNGEVIRSFSDLLKNIERLFRKSPAQFILGALGALTGSFGAPGGGAGLGMAAGGVVPGRGAPSLAHVMAPIGRAFGGAIDATRSAFARPAGLPASDTVAAWLTPGEFVQPLPAVRAYGPRVMEAIRRVAIDPGVMSMLAGGISVPAPVSSRLPRGYASGGSVAGGMGGSSSMPVVQPAIVASEATMEQLVSGGRTSLLKFLHESGVAFR